jgi:catechol 2,3-dioxygenase
MTGLVTAMGYIAIRTSDLARSVEVAEGFLGLTVTDREHDCVYLTAAAVHHELVYIKSASDGLDHLGLVARDGEALAELRARVGADGFEVISERPLVAGVEDGFAFVGPEGFMFCIYVGMAATSATALRSYGPDRFGHVNLHPQDPTAMTAFLVDGLGFSVSDTIGEDFAYFLRCNSDHHAIALIKGPGKLHHHAWQTQSIADLGRLADRLDASGEHLIWGPVRHGAGHNIAAYYVEPSGVVVELYTDLEQIYDDARRPTHWDAGDRRWFNRWGTYAGDDFRSHGIFPGEVQRQRVSG